MGKENDAFLTPGQVFRFCQNLIRGKGQTSYRTHVVQCLHYDVIFTGASSRAERVQIAHAHWSVTSQSHETLVLG